MNRVKQNLHTHSCYDDGQDTIEQMVESAREKGFNVLGFSGHAWNAVDDCSMTPEKTRNYMADVKRARANPPEGMEIFLGIEEDSLNPVDPSQFDYVIGSVHFLEKNGQAWPIDYSPARFDEMLQEGWNGEIYGLARDYYQALELQADIDWIDIIGHIDLISKYNEDEKYFAFDDPQILAMSKKAVEKLAAAGKLFEMNTGAIARGYRTTPYPSRPILDQIFQAGGKLLINTDCHNRKFLDLGIDQCIQIAKEAGFTVLYRLSKQGFVPLPIAAFEKDCKSQAESE